MKNKQYVEPKILPNGWANTIIEKICQKPQYGWTTKANNNGAIKLLRTTDITSGEINWNRVPFCENTPKNLDKYLLHKNDVVISRAGSIGFSYLLNDVKDTVFASYLIRFKTHINTKFFYYFLQSPFYWNAIREKKIGSSLANVNATKLKSIQILVPPLNEQKRIVSKIESILTQINILDKSLKSVRSRMGQYKQSVLKLAFDGKLVPQKLGTSWQCVKISEVCEIIGGGTPPRKHSEYFGGDIIWLTPTEISKTKVVLMTDSREKITQSGLKHSSAKIIPKDAVLLTSRASIGYVAISGTSLTTNQGFMSFACSNKIHNYFLAYWLVSNRCLIERRASGTTFKEITKSKMREFVISIPSILEQKRIASKIESIFVNIDAIDTHITALLETLTMLKRSMLKRAFEGKLVPQDPSDEPANILLERIRGMNNA